MNALVVSWINPHKSASRKTRNNARLKKETHAARWGLLRGYSGKATKWVDFVMTDSTRRESRHSPNLRDFLPEVKIFSNTKKRPTHKTKETPYMVRSPIVARIGLRELLPLVVTTLSCDQREHHAKRSQVTMGTAARAGRPSGRTILCL